MKDLFHQALKGGEGGDQSKWQHLSFSEARAGCKGRPFLGICLNVNLQVATSQVYSAEIPAASESIQILIYARQRIRILQCNAIQLFL